LIKYQSAPFYVPDFLPEFLFPRASGSGQRQTMDNLEAIFSADNKNNFRDRGSRDSLIK
jgi:hypothetical protein